jgi:flagellar biosynthesis anti-sigma factor FlgM
MRVNLNQAAQTAAESNTAASAARNNQAAANNVFGEDQAQLSGVHVQVQALAAQVAQLPEVRQERVNALRQVVSEGSYQPGPEQTAQAMLDHMLVAPAA